MEVLFVLLVLGHDYRVLQHKFINWSFGDFWLESAFLFLFLLPITAGAALGNLLMTGLRRYLVKPIRNSVCTGLFLNFFLLFLSFVECLSE